MYRSRFRKNIMKILLLAALVVGTAWAKNRPQDWSVTLDSDLLTIHMDQKSYVPFVVTFPNSVQASRVKLAVFNTNTEVVDADVPDLPEFVEPGPGGVTQWNDSVIIKGAFLGKANVNLRVHSEDGTFRNISNSMEVTVIRAERLVDTFFTASVATLVSILYINFGCAMDWSVCRSTLRKPIGPAIGAFCQFIIMPLLSYIIGYLLFPDRPEMQLGIFFTGISPSGGASNIWTVLLGGNLNLSVTMTTLGTIASFATMPLWIFTLGKRIFDKGNIVVPYSRVATLAVGLVIPLGLGYLIQKKLPRLSRLLVRIMKPFSGILILFIIVFAIATNLYLFKLFSWQIAVSGMGLAWLGFICGWIAMFLFRQPDADVRAIAIETGIQNTGIAIFLLRFSLAQPAADLTTVIPVACAIMTPIPLAIFWLIRLMFERRKKKFAASMEKLQTVAEPVSAITPTSQTAILP